MKRIILIPLAATLVATFSTAALAAPETFVIDGTHTLPRFSYSHFGYSTPLSRFDKTSGKIVLDRQATVTFTSNKLKFKGEDLVAVDGTLTLKGISKPVTLKVTSFQCMPHPMLNKEACGANATTVVKRTDFNMGKYAPHVGDEVTITLPVEAVKE